MKSILYAFLIVIFTSCSILAQWQLNGVAVCDTVGEQYIATNGILSDGEGGAFVVWGDGRSGWDIYAQHVDSSGRMLWGRQGKPICTAPGWQYAPRITIDGEGGFVAAWHDTRNDARDVYAQRVDKYGNFLWDINGIPIINFREYQGVTDILFTSDSCFIVVWTDDRQFPDSTFVYTQKVTKSGQLLWDEEGIRVSDTWGTTKLVSDLSGGALCIWPKTGDTGILVQHIDMYGTRLWGKIGKEASIDFAKDIDTRLSVCSDSSAGAFIAWDNDKTMNAYIQHIDSDGNRLWGDTGIKLGAENIEQRNPKLSLLDKETVLCIWRESPYTHFNTYDLNGNNLLPLPGNQINNYISGPYHNIMVNKSGEIFISNFNLTTPMPNRFKIHAHKISSDGFLYWDSTGIKICDIEIDPLEKRAFLATDCSGGTIVAWDDDRNDTTGTSETDIYIQRVYANGRVGGDTTTSSLREPGYLPLKFELNVYPNPFNQDINIEFKLKQNMTVIIKIFDIQGRIIKSLYNGYMLEGYKRYIWNGKSNSEKVVSSGIYFILFSTSNIKEIRKILLLK